MPAGKLYIASKAKRSFRPKRSYKKRGKSSIRAYRMASLALQRSHMPERKYKDVILGLTNIGTGIQFNQMTNLAEGTSSTSRIGLKVRWVNILWRFVTDVNTAVTSSSVRMILLLDKQPNGAQFADADFLETVANYQSPIKKGSGRRFNVLFDRTYTIQSDDKFS